MERNAKTFAENLITWYRRNGRDLPFRKTADPYWILVSEIMLQQTRMETALPYYERFLQAFPDVVTLARAEPERVLKLWEGLGYYRRALNLHKAARMVADDFRGTFPEDSRTLSRLPGVGNYTAAAVAAIAFKKDTPAVDGNVMRIMSRIMGLYEDIRKTTSKQAVERRLKEPIQHVDSRMFTEGLLDLGALVCQTAPLCARCPVPDYCFAYEQKRTAELPLRPAKKEKTVETFYTFIVRGEEGILLEKHADDGLLGGLYGLPQYPGGYARAKERLQTTYGLDIVDEQSLGTFQHVFSHRVWRMEVHLLDVRTATAGFHDVETTPHAIARAHGRILEILDEQ